MGLNEAAENETPPNMEQEQHVGSRGISYGCQNLRGVDPAMSKQLEVIPR